MSLDLSDVYVAIHGYDDDIPPILTGKSEEWAAGYAENNPHLNYFFVRTAPW